MLWQRQRTLAIDLDTGGTYPISALEQAAGDEVLSARIATRSTRWTPSNYKDFGRVCHQLVRHPDVRSTDIKRARAVSAYAVAPRARSGTSDPKGEARRRAGLWATGLHGCA